MKKILLITFVLLLTSCASNSLQSPINEIQQINKGTIVSIGQVKISKPSKIKQSSSRIGSALFVSGVTGIEGAQFGNVIGDVAANAVGDNYKYVYQFIVTNGENNVSILQDDKGNFKVGDKVQIIIVNNKQVKIIPLQLMRNIKN